MKNEAASTHLCNLVVGGDVHFIDTGIDVDVGEAGLIRVHYDVAITKINIILDISSLKNTIKVNKFLVGRKF